MPLAGCAITGPAVIGRRRSESAERERMGRLRDVGNGAMAAIVRGTGWVVQGGSTGAEVARLRANVSRSLATSATKSRFARLCRLPLQVLREHLVLPVYPGQDAFHQLSRV